MLTIIWFLLWGILWAVYFILDGFDLGLGTLSPFLSKNEKEKQTLYQAIGPFWNGNEVWLITAGGVTFAAFPTTYAVMFSSLYSALMLVLFALIIRGISMEFRGLVQSPGWKRFWDGGVFIGSFLPALLFGVAFANIFKGLPINAEGINQGGLIDLLNPYGLLGGVLFLFLFLQHGALWLARRTEGDLSRRAGNSATGLWIPVLVLAVLFLAATYRYTPLWNNYFSNPLLLIIPLLAVACLLLTRVMMAGKSWTGAWMFSAGTIGLCTLFGVIGLYPNLFPSSLNPAWSLTVSNSSSSPLTLKIMLGVALVVVPIVIIYQILVYRAFNEKISAEHLEEEAY
jgi:cytochrome bd ubiquinol oxidase subunit II